MTHITDDIMVGPLHSSYSLDEAWFVFGIFSQNGTCSKTVIVRAPNNAAVHFIEMVARLDGSVSPTCGLLMVCKGVPQIRSTHVEEMEYQDFVLNMVQDERWTENHVFAEMFKTSVGYEEP